MQAPYTAATAQALLLDVAVVAEVTAPTNSSLVPSDLSTTASLILNTVDYLLFGIATGNGTQEIFLNDVSLNNHNLKTVSGGMQCGDCFL